MKRLPSIREIALKFANVDCIKEPIPVVPTIHYQMGGIPTNVHGQVVAPKDGDSEGGRQRPLRGRRVRVRVGARRQPARHQFAARPHRVRPRRRQSHRRAEPASAQAHKPLPPDAGDTRARAPRPPRRRDVAASRCREVAQRPAQGDAGALRRVPQPGAADRGRAPRCMEIEERVRAHGDQGQEPHVQHRARRGAGARQPDRDGEGDRSCRPRRAANRAARRRAATTRTATTSNWLKHTLWYRDGNRLDYKPVNLKPLSVDAFPPKARTY